MAAIVAVAGTLSSCGNSATTAPRCGETQRVGVIAQAVPDATLVPCVAKLPTGWSVPSFHVRTDSAHFLLRSDREAVPVAVSFADRCEVRRTTPIAPRSEGVRTYIHLDSIDPRYAGQILDVFPGGCVTFAFDFARGPHISLIDDLSAVIGLYPRRELRQDLREQFGITLDR